MDHPLSGVGHITGCSSLSSLPQNMRGHGDACVMTSSRPEGEDGAGSHVTSHTTHTSTGKRRAGPSSAIPGTKKRKARDREGQGTCLTSMCASQVNVW